MIKKAIVIGAVLAVAGVCRAEYDVDRTEALDIGALEGKGQVASPARSPEGEALVFEFLGANGESLEVYVAETENPAAFPLKLKAPYTAVPQGKDDVFSLGGPGERVISEQAAWGPSTKRGTQLVFAATRREASRGAAQISFDLMYVTKGKRNFITDHPENDSEPSFSPSGEHLAFASGRTGEGDIYVYSFFGEGAPLTRLTFEETGSELYPAWSHDGKRLAYIGHLGGADHLVVVDDVAKLLAQKTDQERMAAARAVTRDLTPGWRHSCLAPSFSPDSKWIAFYMHPKGELRSDLYVVRVEGGEPQLLMENVLPGTRSGPCWSPDGDGVFAVEENAQLMNPIVFVPLNPALPKKRLATGTQLNVDLTSWKSGEALYLLYAAQGGGEKDPEKRWRKIFETRLVRK